tara:strand:- start:6459 stop:7544 length:1086 start_codon:yes stop_codon:yes gene_type:complete
MRFCRIADGVSLADAQQHLSDADTAYWIEGDTIAIVARRPAGDEPAMLCCALQETLDLLDDGQIWGARFAIADLDQAFIDILVFPALDAADGSGGQQQPLTFRGPNAPPAPPTSSDLAGTLEDIELFSDALDMSRTLTIYTPPGEPPADGWPVVYMADGSSVTWLGRFADALIQRGDIGPVMLVGLWNAPAPPLDLASFSPRTDPRSQEYLWGIDPERFQAYDAFLMDEVIPLTVRDYSATEVRDQRMLFGSSSGAAWAISAGLLHPAEFGHVTGASFGWNNAVSTAEASSESPVFYLSAGEFEPTFLNTSRQAIETLTSAGAEAHLQSFVSGHSPLAFALQFETGLKAAFPADPGPVPER